MKKKNFESFILFFFVFFLCINNAALSQEKDSAVIKLNILQKILNKPDSFYGKTMGRPIDSKYVLPCHKLFKADMYRHGIDSLQQRSKIIWRKTRKITHWESFAGPELLNWMLDIYKQFPGETPNNIEVRVIFGVYTKDFIDNFPGTQDRKNRITAFLVPYLIKPGINNKKAATMGSSAYELGNLHP